MIDRIDYDQHILLKPGDPIYFIVYYDHSQTKRTINDLRENPPMLYSIGKIVNLHTEDLFYIVINSGAVKDFKPPVWKNTIMKQDILYKKVIYTIPENFYKNGESE